MLSPELSVTTAQPTSVKWSKNLSREHALEANTGNYFLSDVEGQGMLIAS